MRYFLFKRNSILVYRFCEKKNLVQFYSQESRKWIASVDFDGLREVEVKMTEITKEELALMF